MREPSISTQYRHVSLLSLLVSGSILIMLCSHIDVHAVWQSFHLMPFRWIGVALVLSSLSLLLRTLRWQIILQHTTSPWRLRQLFPLVLAGVSLSLCLPSGFGEMGRAYYGAKQLGSSIEMWSSTIMDKWIGLLGAVLLGVWASLMTQQRGYLIIALIGLGLLGVSAWIMHGKYPLNGRMMSEARRTFWIHFALPWPIFSHALALSLLGWIVSYGQFFILMQAVTKSITVWQIYAVAPLLTLASFMPGTVAGIGSREAAAMTLLQGYGGTPVEILAACLWFSLTAVVLPGLLGIIVIARR